jgi:hypothetical protein
VTDQRIVKNQGAKPCGCQMTEYSDGSKVIAPCPPCGLFAAGEALGQASQALMAAASTLRASQQAAMVDNAIKSAATGPRIVR